jgi:hypothetical protein
MIKKLLKGRVDLSRLPPRTREALLRCLGEEALVIGVDEKLNHERPKEKAHD